MWSIHVWKEQEGPHLSHTHSQAEMHYVGCFNVPTTSYDRVSDALEHVLREDLSLISTPGMYWVSYSRYPVLMFKFEVREVTPSPRFEVVKQAC